MLRMTAGSLIGLELGRLERRGSSGLLERQI